ncbi:helix-hairpin-helix domain-containing protein [bacterium]|nr:MAG: helix-hairpin-helix domain-containing protein [bacterium]
MPVNKKMKRVLWVLVLLLLVKSQYTAGQTTDSTEVLEKTVEYAVEAFDPESTLNAEELAEYLQLLAQQPININRAGIDELIKVPGINFKMAQGIVEYRKKKPFETVRELVNVKGIGAATLAKVSPYITVGSSGAVQKALLMSANYWNQKAKLEHITRFQTVLEEQAGYETGGSYRGDPYKVYHRTSYTTEHASLNLTLEKDPGETWNAPVGYDFSSFHVAVKDVGKVKQLVFGDYSLSFGQGLVLWNGGAFGKGNDVINAVSRSERGLRSYRSTLETAFQRGVAVTLGETYETTLFFSSKNETASIVSGDTIRFPSSTGLHRTSTEIERRYNAPVTMYGGRFRWKLGTGWIGVTGFGFQSDKYILPGTALSNQYDFEGKELHVFGLDYSWFWQTVALSGEIGRSKNGALAWVQTAQWIMSEQTEFSLGIRSYAKDYQNPFASGFAESSGQVNEFGIYTGLAHRFSRDFLIRMYFDQYQFPFARFGTTQSTKGYDWLIYSEYIVNRSTQLNFLARYEQKEDDRDELQADGREYSVLDPQTRWSARTDFVHQLLKNVRIRFRIEYVNYEDFDQNDSGWEIYQDVRWNVNKKLQIDARLSYFDTDSYDSRIYQYENDVLYALSNPVLSGLGQRSYVLIKYSPIKAMDLWFKYDISIYENEQTVGSGNDLIQGNSRSRATVQIRYSF